MRLYRLMTGGDDVAFCKRVSQALNRGWELHGSPTVAYDMANARIVCAHARGQGGRRRPERRHARRRLPAV